MYIFSFLAALFSVLPALGIAAGGPITSLAPILEPILPAVVNVSSNSRVKLQESPLFQDPLFRRFFDLPEQPRQRIARSLGSGVILDAVHGYVVTNNHVINKSYEITVTLQDGRILKARLVGSDPETDIAVIQIPAENLVAIPLGNSDQLRVGDFVAAIGNPFGLGQSVTSGLVSALGRTGLGIEGYENFIQTDASINPGNSGGALIDLSGELIGINTAILAPNGGNIGIGFAIPVNIVKQVVPQLISHGQVQRGRLGLQLEEVTAELASELNIPPQGAVVVGVNRGSSAARAGLRAGDVIVAINDHQIRDNRDLRASFGILAIGSKAKLEVIRNGRHLNLEVTVLRGHQSAFEGGQIDRHLRGALFASPTNEDIQGVVVSKVQTDSSAAELGLQEGDLLVGFNGHQINRLDDLERLARSERSNTLLDFRRGEGRFQIFFR